MAASRECKHWHHRCVEEDQHNGTAILWYLVIKRENENLHQWTLRKKWVQIVLHTFVGLGWIQPLCHEVEVLLQIKVRKRLANDDLLKARFTCSYRSAISEKYRLEFCVWHTRQNYWNHFLPWFKTVKFDIFRNIRSQFVQIFACKIRNGLANIAIDGLSAAALPQQQSHRQHGQVQVQRFHCQLSVWSFFVTSRSKGALSTE